VREQIRFTFVKFWCCLFSDILEMAPTQYMEFADYSGCSEDGCEVCKTFRYPQHEEEVGELARELGFTHVSLSSAIMPMARIVPRGFTGHFYHNYC